MALATVHVIVAEAAIDVVGAGIAVEQVGVAGERDRSRQVTEHDIAALAGVAKGTLYRYYRDKEDIYLALTIHAHPTLSEGLMEAAESLLHGGDT